MLFSSSFFRKKQRYCRVGAGIEQTFGKCDTEGFPFSCQDAIVFDNRGFKKLTLKRSISRIFHQSSMITLQSWRANCDVKFLIKIS